MADALSKSSAERLATPVQFLKGVGPQKAELLAKLDLCYASDLLFFFPRAYQDATALKEIHQLEENQPASVYGEVEEVDLRNTGPGRNLLGVLVRQGSSYLRALWFNQPWMREKLPLGARVLFTGTVRLAGGRWEMTHPQVQILEADQPPPPPSILPVYPLTEGLNQPALRRIVEAAVAEFGELVEESFPPDYLDEHQLWPIRAALPQIHNPTSQQSLAQAQRRFIYQELFTLQLALALRRHALREGKRAPALPLTAKIDARIRRLLPFELTPGQVQAIGEISADLAREFPMNRLLQGDVGSGKTAVAVYAMLGTVAHGYQAALMAPTEVLARQHFHTLAKLLAAGRVRMALLSGSLSASERTALLLKIAAGEIDLVVGTQAIVQADVYFQKLGLVVIDEQHKFGVRQRAKLKQAGLDPHYLVMTATPIPRTLSMTQFGDLDVSTLADSPPGRQPVHTYFAAAEQREKWWDFFRKKLREGRQGFVITPLVEGTADDDSRAIAGVEQAFEALANGELEEFRLNLVHGRLPPEEKEAAMEAFRSGQTQVLVATSVVEVGVDVPNATLMTIENGERFGLAQLHQLRGRICRGNFPGYVTVFADLRTEEARRRLEAFTQTTNGFELAELDFSLRGPGDLFGTRQHGLPPLRIADLVRDAEILAEARRDALEVVAADPNLASPLWARLRKMVLSRYGQALELGDVG